MWVGATKNRRPLRSGQRLEVGIGAAEVLAVPGEGVVLSRHRAGVWLRLPGGICGLASGEAALGPLWARGQFPWEQLDPGRRVVVRCGDLVVGGATLAVSGPEVVVWRGALPRHQRVEAPPARRLAVAALAAARPPAVLEAPLAGAAERAASAVAGGDLRVAAAELGGLGPGLTPAGDDILAGLLLAARARFGPLVEAGLLTVAASVATTDLSGAFLHWAARGQHVAFAHDLLTAAVRGDRSAVGAAVTALGAFGSSSGPGLAYGLRLGLGRLPAIRPRLGRTGGEGGFCPNLSLWRGIVRERDEFLERPR
jgi:uncharacterized protein DUF2877